MVEPTTVAVCVKISGVLDGEGKTFTPEALRKIADDDPDTYWTKEKPDGRVELWTRVDPVASPLSSKE